MRTFVAVMQREILQRKQILMAAAGLALVPFLARYLPNVAASDRPEVTMIVGMIVLSAYGIATPLALGASMIGRDLSEKRLGFYFSRPISARALFWGKFAGSLLIVVAAVAMILLPLILFEPEIRKTQSGWEFFFAGPICLLLVANVIGSIVRSRSKISAVDLALATLAGFSIYSLVRRFLFSGAENGAIAVAIVFGVALVAGLAAASIAHVAHGRTDPKRGHAALSVTLWSVVGTALVGLLAYTLWFFASGPGDLVRVGHAYALSSGPRVVVNGPVRGRLGFWQGFIVDPSTGKPVRLESRGDFPRVFSRDGSTVAWVRPASIKTTTGEVLTLDLGRNDPRPRQTAIFASVHDKLVLSPSGERAAIFAGEETLTVYELSSGQALFSARIPRAKTDRSRMTFVTGDLLRVVVYGVNARAVSLFDVDVPGRRLVRKASATLGWKALLVSASPAGDRLLLRGGDDHPLAVIDVGTGKRLDLPGSPGAKGLPALLWDGRVVIPRVANGAASLELRTKEGALERVIPLGPFGRRVWIGWEVAPGKLLVTVHRSSEGTPEPAGWTALLVDLEKGEIVGRESGLRMPDSILRRWVESDLLDGPVVGSPGAMTFLDAQDSVVRWNPLTGEKTVVFKPR